MKISACIITFNEEKNISRAINSVKWADEIVVVDSESTDSTRQIAAQLGAKVIKQKWLGFALQKQLAVNLAENDWIFSLDADEEVSEELKNEILRLKTEENLADAYKIPRLPIYMNRKILHGGWYPDWQIRLFNRKKGRWREVLIHESVQMDSDARVSKLKGEIFHYSVENFSHHNQMIAERYAPLAARQMFEEGKRTSFLKIVFSGCFAFIRSYFLKLGFLDGFPGFCIAYFAAHHATMKHLLLWEIQNGLYGRDSSK
ncbi:MAG: glycosyltransferase family 2 protein [Pyrinomonadaceae bacterium]|nr:glycosyltransferase family 2 protein [Pyrinomonadaceae bacterium]MCX7640496.1 glycosyltransferase family 2 protein [Pyrinomonadaceae bacterium]MDW8305193.1 glycosyltransferase family 2 protein [Acidobacteriota bacterium]